MDQVVSNGELTEQIDNEQINTLDEQNESSLLINNPKTDTNKINVSSMEPFLSLDENLTTNIINDLSNIEAKKLNPDDELSNDNNQTEEAKLNAETIKSNLSLNLNESELPKNKKFLESSDDQIINQIFFQTITNTPTIDEGFPEIAFTELGTKAEEDDSTYTDTVDNYQDNEPNLCSLNDNFDENYCSFNSTERQPLNQPTDVDFAPYDLEASNPAEYENRLFAMEQLKNQRPSIVIDCYEDDEEEQEGTSETVKEPLEAKVENYCFYFDQTIEEDDEDVIDINGSSYGNVEDIDTVLDNNLTNVNNLIDDEDQSVSEDELTDDDVNSRIKVLNENCMSVHSAIESFESEKKIVKKTSKKVKTSKTTTKQTQSSSICSSKEESFCLSSIEQHRTSSIEESITGTSSLTNAETSKQEEAIENDVIPKVDKKKKAGEVNGKKKAKKSKKSESEKENISVCRSFGDLKAINDDEHFNQVYPPQSLQKNNKGISKRRIKLGIKQFDMKSSFSKFDALQKKNLQNLQGGKEGLRHDLEKKCHECDKVVFQMEQVQAEKRFWHKNCFRCSECNKQLNVDTYMSHESVLYCKPHFKSLFAPKAVEDNSPTVPKRAEMIIRENQPTELPPDVIRSSDKSNLGLEELQQLNVRSRYQVFENASQETKMELERSPTGVKRSTSILSKLARFQAKGMDVGVDESLNGISFEHSSSGEDEDEEEDDENNEDIELIRAKRAQKERPMAFANMNDIKTKFENGESLSKEERREERKQELQNIRSRLFMGKQARIKEMYQQAVAESEQTITAAGKSTDFEMCDKATQSLKERFEKGEAFNNSDDFEGQKQMNPEDVSAFEQGLGKKSRSLFLELDATAAKNSNSVQQSPSSANLGNRMTSRQNSNIVLSKENVMRSDTKLEDVQIETADVTSKFKFFETYKPSEKEKKRFRITPPRDGVTKDDSPEKEIYRDPLIARSEMRTETDEILELAEQTHTTAKMLSMFRQMEEHKELKPAGPKPLKRFTPPPDDNKRMYTPNSDDDEYSDEEYDEEEEEEENEEEINPNYVKSSQKSEDEFLKLAQSADRANKLRDKFEKWEKNEIKKEMNNSSVNLYDSNNDESQVESAKTLRARFEQMQNEGDKLSTPTKIKVNRFV